MRLDTALWRALALYRFAALVYAAASMAAHRSTYHRPGLGLAVLALMALWTLLTTLAYDGNRRPGWPLLVTDLAVTVAAQLSSVLILTAGGIRAGDPTVTVSWAAAPVLVWAVWGGPLGGVVAAAVVSVGAVVERGSVSQATTDSIVLLLLAGGVVGYLVRIGRRAESAYAGFVRLQAAAQERERLARSVHDGVLQALALVSRTSKDPALADLAASQASALRRLVSGPAEPLPIGELDLLGLMPTGSDVELAAPAGAVLLPSAVAMELAAAVAAAVDNARQHAGGCVWLLVEDEADAVTVTVRDDGPGIAAGRLEQAEQQGRLGVARSVRGRLADLGGSVAVHSTAETGTEVELRVPR